MPELRERYGQLELLVGGRSLPDDVAACLTGVEVVQALDTPSRARLTYAVGADEPESAGDHVDALLEAILDAGGPVEVAVAADRGRSTLFVGEIATAALEAGRSESSPSLVVTAFDAAHRLAASDERFRVFREMSVVDIIADVAHGAGLECDSRVADSGATLRLDTSTQAGRTDWAFVRELAARYGLVVYVVGTTLRVERPGDGARATLTWGADLTDFRPVTSVVETGTQVEVRGWDPFAKVPITGSAGAGSRTATVRTVVDIPVRTRREAGAVARALADAAEASRTRGHGVVRPGDPAVAPGTTAQVVGLGRRFGGDHLVTSARHEFTTSGEYVTTFAVGEDHSPAPAVAPPRPRPSHGDPLAQAVLAGVVVERADLDGSPRVRVALPWLASEPVETAWAPVATPGAGAQRGAYLVPDVGDEVVVAFDRGDFDHPIVVGGLWNAQDRSPEDGADGQVRTQSITSRSGHVIRFEDDEGEEQVVVQSGAGPITIQADGDVNVVSVEGAIRVEGNDLELRAAGDLHVGADGDVTIEAGGSMYLKSGADTVVHADHDLSISSAADLRLDADLRLNAKAALEAKIDGGTKATLRAATTDVHGDASTTIKGGVVMIN